MASIKSLGVHKPSALDYLIAESILPPEPSESLYDWSVYDDNGLGEEELLSTQKCVVWSQAGVIRRVFRFEREGQNVKQAILTRFLAKDGNAGIQNGKNGTKPAAADKQLARALVVILRHQAHVFFLHGSSHIVNLPFDVDKAFAAPIGLLLQRQISNSELVPPTPVPPAAPPNSFMSSQRSAWTSSIPNLRPKSGSNVPKQPKSLSDFTVGTSAQTTDNMPRLFMLRDPVTEIGLVCVPLQTGTAVDFEAVDGNEEVCYMSSSNEANSPAADPFSPLSIVVTMNRAKSTYTIWNTMSREQLKRFSPIKDKRKRLRHSFPAKRHSSFTTRMSTGTSSPALRGSELARDISKGGQPILSTSQGTSNRLSDAYQLAAEEDYGFSGTDDTLFPQKSRTSKGNRRTSSLMARAELSSQDQNAFTDLARNPASANTSFAGPSRRGPSFTGIQDRGSFGRVRLSGRASTPGSFLSDLEESSQHESGPSDSLDIVAASNRAELERSENLEYTAGLSKELIMFKIKQIPFGRIHAGNEPALTNGKVDVKVFTAASATQRNFCGLNENLSMFFIDHVTGRASEMLLKLRHARVTNHDWIAAGSRLSVSKDSPEFNGDKVLDMAKVSDHGLCRVLCLSQGVNDSLICITPKSEAVEDDTQSSINELPIPESIFTDSNHLKGQPKKPQPKGKDNDQSNTFSHSAQWLRFANVGDSGAFDLFSRDGMYRRIQVRFQPRNGYVLKAMNLCCLISSPHLAGSSDFRVIWCKIMSRSGKEDFETEWHAFVTTLFYFIILRTDSHSGATDLISEEAQGHFAPLDMHDRSNTDWPGLADNPSWAWLNDELSSHSAATKGQAIEKNDRLKSCVDAARRLIQEDDSSPTSMPPPGSAQNKKLERIIQRLIVALDLLYEEQKLSSTSNEGLLPDFLTLGDVLAQIGTWLAWPQWIWNSPEATQMLISTPPRWIFDTNFPDLESIFVSVGKEQSSTDQMELKRVADGLVKRFTPRTYALRSFFRSMKGAAKSTQEVVECLVKNDMALATHETLPEVLQLPTRAYIRNAQAATSTTWGKSLLKLVSRQDLGFLLNDGIDFTMSEGSNGSHYQQKADIHTICQRAEQSIDDAANYSNGRNGGITTQVFSEDRRAEEAAKLLDPLRVAIAQIHPKPNATESEFLEEQKTLAQLVYQRTMASPSGQGIMKFGTQRPVPTERLTIASFNTTCNMQPSNNTVNADKSNFTEEKVGWAFFHAGVNAGLQICQNAAGIDTSWLILNKPAELGNRHAGLLLALGMNGHLKKMAKWLAFKYLTPKHAMTSVGLLLGLSASNLGTMDSLVTRILSVHITRLLPLGAAELNVSPLTQTAGIMGIGLLYYNTQHRRMSEVMLSEIEHVELEESTGGQESFRSEGYRLAAGFALGFMNLGKGKDLTTLHDLRVVERLLLVATGPRGIKYVHILDQASAGATIAIALIFLKTGDRTVARKIDIPNTVAQFDYVRPDLLLLRTVAKWLILWDEIEPTLQWVYKNYPEEWRQARPRDPRADFKKVMQHRPFATGNIPLYNVLAGLCWSIALKHAGTGSESALSVLEYYFAAVREVLLNSALSSNSGERAGARNTFDENLTLDCLLRFQHLLALSMAMVCAGTGNLQVLRYLRGMHADVQTGSSSNLNTSTTPETSNNTGKPFGYHQAAHTALGLLFMGEGCYSLHTSDLGVAAMLAAFYPVFPKDVLDNRAHLQALRHFWVFAAEPRCLILRDWETRGIVGGDAPVRVVLKDGREVGVGASSQDAANSAGDGGNCKTAACILPELRTIARVHIQHPEYWPVTLDFEGNTRHMRAFVRHQTVFLVRKSLLQVYGGDLFAAEYAKLEEDDDDDDVGDYTRDGSSGDGGGGVGGADGEDIEIKGRPDAAVALKWVLNLPTFKENGLDEVVAGDLMVPRCATERSHSSSSFSPEGGNDETASAPPVSTLLDARTTAVDDFLVLLGDAKSGGMRDRLVLLKCLVGWLGRGERDDGGGGGGGGANGSNQQGSSSFSSSLPSSPDETEAGAKANSVGLKLDLDGWLRREWVQAVRREVVGRVVREREREKKETGEAGEGGDGGVMDGEEHEGDENEGFDERMEVED
ncbi:MAG: Anaphase-promoting complex subunit 1 [Alyxoria varia]|nr:MAG: Anaphase-promoting complex subunit 1 [Alyxoria varia]